MNLREAYEIMKNDPTARFRYGECTYNVSPHGVLEYTFLDEAKKNSVLFVDQYGNLGPFKRVASVPMTPTEAADYLRADPSHRVYAVVDGSIRKNVSYFRSPSGTFKCSSGEILLTQHSHKYVVAPAVVPTRPEIVPSLSSDLLAAEARANTAEAKLAYLRDQLDDSATRWREEDEAEDMADYNPHNNYGPEMSTAEACARELEDLLASTK